MICERKITDVVSYNITPSVSICWFVSRISQKPTGRIQTIIWTEEEPPPRIEPINL